MFVTAGSAALLTREQRSSSSSALSFALPTAEQQDHCFLASHANAQKDVAGRGAVAAGRQGADALAAGTFPVASVSLRLWDGLRLTSKQQDASIRQTFNQIDQGGKGHITEADLASFAEAQGLPAAYVRPFMTAVLAQQHGEHSGLSDQEAAEAELTYGAFSRFVKAREAGLRQAFSLFDTDGDGLISAGDLEASLGQVAVSCPRTRCVYRTKEGGVHALVAKMGVAAAAGSMSAVPFSEFRQYFMLLPQQDLLVEYWLGDSACADLGTRVTLQEEHRGTAPWGHLLAGAVAGAASRTATAPLETLRLAAMAGTLPPNLQLGEAAQFLMAGQGWRGLYRGNLINVIRSSLSRGLDFWGFDQFKGWLGDGGPDAGRAPWRTFAAAGCAGATSWLLLYPLEVVRSRLTVDSAGRYAGILHCGRAMLATEGPGAFVRGLGPSLAAIFPEAAITYGLHDRLKRSYRAATHTEPGILPSLSFGVVSAWCGQLVAYPLETISRRMQLAAAAGALSTAPAAAVAAAGAVEASSMTTAAAAAAAGSAAAAAAAPVGGGLAALMAPLSGLGSSGAAVAAGAGAGGAASFGGSAAGSLALPYSAMLQGGAAAGLAHGAPLTPLVTVPVSAAAAATGGGGGVAAAGAAGGLGVGAAAAHGVGVGANVHVIGTAAAAAAGAAGAATGGGSHMLAAAAGHSGGGAAAASAAAGRQLLVHKGPWLVLQDILAESGPAGLYRGLGAATLRLVPAAVVSFGIYELMRQQILQWEAPSAAATARQQCQQLRHALQVKHCSGLAAAAAAGNGGGACGSEVAGAVGAQLGGGSRCSSPALQQLTRPGPCSGVAVPGVTAAYCPGCSSGGVAVCGGSAAAPAAVLPTPPAAPAAVGGQQQAVDGCPTSLAPSPAVVAGAGSCSSGVAMQ